MNRARCAVRVLAILAILAASSPLAWAAEHPAAQHPAGPPHGGSAPTVPEPGASQPIVPQPVTLRLLFDVVSGDPHDTVNLSARLVQADGKPIGSRPVIFFVRTAVFGNRLMPLGTANTDSSGTAAMTYTPTWEGDQHLVLRFAGDVAYASAETTATALVRVATPAYQAEQEPLIAARRWLPVAAGAVVVGVWGVLIRLLLAVLRGLPVTRGEGALDRSVVGRVGYRPAPHRTEHITHGRWHA